MQADRGEVPLDHDQVLAVPGPVQVEELELLAKPGRQLVLALPFGKAFVRPCPATGISNGPPVTVLDRDADPPRHDALLAVPEAECLDELGRDARLRCVEV